MAVIHGVCQDPRDLDTWAKAMGKTKAELEAELQAALEGEGKKFSEIGIRLPIDAGLEESLEARKREQGKAGA